MKRGEVLEAIADLAGQDLAKRQSAIAKLEAMPRGFLDDHPLPKKRVAPFIPRLALLLDADVPPNTMRWCAQLIGDSGFKSPELLAALIGALAHKDENLLVSAIGAIGRYGPGARIAVDSIVPLTAHPNREVRWRAVWALLETRPNGQQHAELFARLFSDSDRLVRGYAVLGFLSAASPSLWAIAQLQSAAQDEDDMPRIHAQRALQQWSEDGHRG